MGEIENEIIESKQKRPNTLTKPKIKKQSKQLKQMANNDQHRIKSKVQNVFRH